MASSPSDLPTVATFHLPIEITIEILSRLPVRSLLRFKSVCKTWYDLIETPNFISKHLQTQSTLDSPSVLVDSYDCETQKHAMSLFFNDGFNNGAVNLDFPWLSRRDSPCASIPDSIGRRHIPVSIWGTCNGLVCTSLSPCGFPLILCNPSTRQFREIPNSEWRLLDDHDPDYMVGEVSFGFGYHSSANDYKLIRIVVYSSPVRPVVLADLYAMSTETWREIEADKLSVFFQNDFGGVGTVVLIVGSSAAAMMNGVFYWRACIISTYEEIEEQDIVLSFDMADEVFRKIRMPVFRDVIWDQSVIWQITELKDKLTMFIYPYPDDKCCDVWVLNEDQSSWTNQFKIESFPWVEHYMGAYKKDEITLVGCAKNGELVVVDQRAFGDLKLFSYDLKTRETTDLYFGQFPYRSAIFLYIGTLLPVMETNEVVLNKKNKKKDYFQSWKPMKSCSTRRTKKRKH